MRERRGTRPSCVSGRCGWCWSIRTSTRRSGRRSVRSPRSRGASRDVAEVGAAGCGRPGPRAGVTTDERERVKEFERENRELRRANEILKAASVFFAPELDG